MLDENFENFVVYVAFFNLTSAPTIYPDKAAQIASLLTKEVKISDKYSDFVDVFLEENTLVLPKRIKLNEHAINLKNGKQQFYGLIYSISMVELETLKTYIEIYLKIEFI